MIEELGFEYNDEYHEPIIGKSINAFTDLTKAKEEVNRLNKLHQKDIDEYNEESGWRGYDITELYTIREIEAEL